MRIGVDAAYDNLFRSAGGPWHRRSVRRRVCLWSRAFGIDALKPGTGLVGAGGAALVAVGVSAAGGP